MRIAVIIPARYASTRFPGKPLADIRGRSMIMHVWDRVRQAQGIEKVVVATDDERIFRHVTENGGEVVMTSPSHESGTSRCAEAARLISGQGNFDAIINVQGDEPFIDPKQVEEVARLLGHQEVLIASLMKKIDTESELLSPHAVKVVTDARGWALYFTRQPVPAVRGMETNQWLSRMDYYKHMGIYGYKSFILQNLARLPIAPASQSESLEQLTWLHQGYKIRMGLTSYESVAIDTPEDLLKVINIK
ncbi:MAG: 3-deoxy-manno-octulosonate cytidylyltransferase [Bacteroidales bacterium]